MPALPDGGRAAAGPGDAPRGDAAREGADEDPRPSAVDAPAVPVHRRRRARTRRRARLIAKAPDGLPAKVRPTRSSAVEPWDAEPIMAALDALAHGRGAEPDARRSQPVRAAVTGSNVSPPLPESLELLGREAHRRSRCDAAG